MQVARRVAPVRKHHHPRQRLGLDHFGEQFAFVFRGDQPELLFDGIHRDVFRFDRDVHRIERPRRREPHHVVIERRAEEQRLAFAFVRRLVDDAAHVRNETHVEHAIGFVDDEHFDAAQVDDAAIDEVEQPTRCRNEDVDRTFRQLQSLFVEVHAADDADDDGVEILREIAAVLFDLDREFARRREHERARRAGRIGGRLRPFPLVARGS